MNVFHGPDDPTEADRTKTWVGEFETVELIGGLNHSGTA